MLFKQTTGLFGYEIVKEGREDVMYVNCLQYSVVPSIASDAIVMAKVIDNLAENPRVSRIVLSQQKNYSYSYEDTQILVEIANLYNFLLKQERLLSITGLTPGQLNAFGNKFNALQYLLLTLLRSDPIGCYVMLTRLLREEKLKVEILEGDAQKASESYISRLEKFQSLLNSTKLIRSIRESVSGFKIGDRNIYDEIFRANTVPNFTFTRLMTDIPLEAELLEEYSVSGSEKSDITILKMPGDVKYLYHALPPEFRLDEDSIGLLDLARQVLLEHRPR
ncbi:MAG: hypothetical protein AABX59_01145, partial [Nanoarchaeota archaeon]